MASFPHAPLTLGDVVVVVWPDDDDLRLLLAAQKVPRLLVIPSDVDPPDPIDALEDWIRASSQPGDLGARTRSLSRRAAQMGGPTPHLDSSGLLHFGGSWTAIPPGQVAVVELLLERINRVVARSELVDAYAAGGGSTHPDSIRTVVARIGKRVAELGLELVAIRARGVMLTTTPPARHRPPVVAER